MTKVPEDYQIDPVKMTDEEKNILGGNIPVNVAVVGEIDGITNDVDVVVVDSLPTGDNIIGKTKGLAYNGTNYFAPRIDKGTRSFITVEYEHHEVHEGDHYNIQYAIADLGAATSPNDMMTLTWTTPDTTKWLHMTVVGISSSGARFRFIEGGTGGGTGSTGIVTAHNSNRNSTNVSTIINVEGTPAAGSVFYDATLVTGGTPLIDEFIGADGLGSSFVAGSSRGAQEWVLKRNTQYQISILDTSNVPGTIQMSWYEHINLVT